MAAVPSGVGANVAVLAVANVLNNRLLPRAYVPTSVATALGLLALARRRGLTLDDLGLSRRTGRRGLTWAAGSVAAVGTVYAIAVARPATRTAFADRRARESLAGAAYQAAVPVLFGTVLLEEVGFRGVLWGQLNRRHGPGVATAASSVLFGLWHILPARDMAHHNRAMGRAFSSGEGSRAVVVASAVAATTAAGVALAELRRRTGSLIAPAGLHWATNGLGYLFAAGLRRRVGRDA
jgi:membrane protease YdiL (CAAX protease family)